MVIEDLVQHLKDPDPIADESRAVNGSGTVGDPGRWGYMRWPEHFIMGLMVRVKLFRAAFNVSGSLGSDLFSSSDTYIRPCWALNSFRGASFDTIGGYPIIGGVQRFFQLPDDDSLAKRLIMPYFYGEQPQRHYSDTHFPYTEDNGPGRFFNFRVVGASGNQFIFDGLDIEPYWPIFTPAPTNAQFPERVNDRNAQRAFGWFRATTYRTHRDGERETIYMPRQAGSVVISNDATLPPYHAFLEESLEETFEKAVIPIDFFGVELYMHYLHTNTLVSFNASGSITFSIEEEWDW